MKLQLSIKLSYSNVCKYVLKRLNLYANSLYYIRKDRNTSSADSILFLEDERIHINMYVNPTTSKWKCW